MTDSRKIVLEPGPETHQLWCDPAPVLSGSGFVPVTESRLIVSCQDGVGRNWQSQNGYLVSAETTFSTAGTAAVGDDYYGIAGEGYIYSLRCQDSPSYDFALPSSGKIELKYQVFDGSRELWSGTATRQSSGPESDSKHLRVLFLHNGLPGAQHGISLLRSLGFEVWEKEMTSEQTDLDDILREIKSLGTGIPQHLVASGRASEAALEIAQRVPELRSVSLFSGSGLRFNPWIIDGKELSFTVCDHSMLQPREGSVLATRKVYAAAVLDRDNRDAGRIEVEKIACPLYLFTGSDDQIWPSAAFSELASQRRGAKGFAELTYHKTFPSVGHDLGPELGLPGLPTTSRITRHLSTGLPLSLGGKMGRQSRARRECWESLFKILEGKTAREFKNESANTNPTMP